MLSNVQSLCFHKFPINSGPGGRFLSCEGGGLDLLTLWRGGGGGGLSNFQMCVCVCVCVCVFFFCFYNFST